ncbi:MAG: ankyrin repeat domain-containing protein [Flavobacteriales bacterium]|nr:ankyrin repeat domain-containing protein [Flavobacteriales bacterium]MBP6699020.1 ankyrin repeat domain-containing protein [Flavobacteriales bacterium]
METKGTNEQGSRRRFLKLVMAGAALMHAPLGVARMALRATPDSEDFLNACARGDLERVQELLAADPTLLAAKDTLGRSGFALALLAGHASVGDHLKASGYLTDLHEAALDTDWERYKELIGTETERTVHSVNADHPIGGTVMWAAAAGGAGMNIWRVYASGGDPDRNPRAAAGSTPLQRALRHNDQGVAEMTAATLLTNNADPAPPPNAELPPLHIAAERGSLQLAEMLIRLGAEVDARDKDGRTAAQLAEHAGHRSVFDLLVDHARISRTCYTSRTAYDVDGHPYHAPDMIDVPIHLQGLQVGRAHRDLDALRTAAAADPRLVHCMATTSERCVEAGAHVGRKDIVDYLLENGAPYALPTAVMRNDLTTVRRLLDEDPHRIHERGAHDFALLWYPVIGGGLLEMAQLLLDRGAKVEEQHLLGTTALHWACREEQIELVDLFVAHGADVDRVGRKFRAEGETPLRSTTNEKIMDHLRSLGAR